MQNYHLTVDKNVFLPTVSMLKQVNIMAKELEYRFPSYEKIKDRLAKLESKLGLSSRIDDKGGIIIKNKDRTLTIHVSSMFTEFKEEVIIVSALVKTPELEDIVQKTLGKPTHARKMGPTLMGVSKVILETPISSSKNDFIVQVCEQLDITEEDFLKYDQLIRKNAKRRRAIPEIKKAAEKLDKLENR